MLPSVPVTEISSGSVYRKSNIRSGVAAEASPVVFSRRRVLNLTEAGGPFPKAKRLLRHADFQQVYQQGRRQFTGNMTVFFLRRSADHRLGADSVRVGFTVGKVLGPSVERNRIKRRMREAVRLSWPAEGAPVDIVFNPRRSVLQVPFAQLMAEVERGLKVALERARQARAQEP